MNIERLASNINRIIFDEDMSWYDLSVITGINYRTLLNIRNKKVKYVQSNTLEKITKALGVDLEELVK